MPESEKSHDTDALPPAQLGGVWCFMCMRMVAMLTLSGGASTVVRAHASVADGALLGSCRPPMQLQMLLVDAPPAGSETLNPMDAGLPASSDHCQRRGMPVTA